MVTWAAAPAFADQAPPPEGSDPVDESGPADESTDPDEAEESEGPGVSLVLPVFRLAFGTSQSVDPGDLGGFAFDLVLGSRLAFRPLGDEEDGGESMQRWRWALTAEAGYSRRAGGFGTHDITLALGAGLFRSAIGVHLFEALTFGVDGNGRIGSRTTLRLETLWGLFHLDVGYEVGFIGGVTVHEIRGVIGIDAGLLISLFVMTGKLYGAR